jgi:hypothetical protein
MTAKLACAAITKTGKPCKAYPLKGRDVCLAHTDEKERVSTGFGVSGGRPKKPRVVDVLRERIEERIDAWLQPLDDALTASRPVLVGAGDDATVLDVPDHAIRLKAFAEAMDRAYGRPKQTQEISGPDGAPIELDAPVDERDRSTRAAVLLRDAGLLAVGAENGNGNGGNGNGHL